MNEVVPSNPIAEPTISEQRAVRENLAGTIDIIRRQQVQIELLTRERDEARQDCLNFKLHGNIAGRPGDETKAERPVRFDLSRSDYDEWSMCPDGTGDYVRWEDVKQFFESSVVEPSAPQTRPCGCIKGCINCAYTGRIEIPAVNGTRDE